MTVTGIDDLRARVVDRAAAAMDAAAERVTRTMHDGVSRRSGELDQSIGWDADDTGTVLRRRVFASAEHASYQDEGTGIYGPRGQRIFPKTAKVLVFDWPAAGGLVFARSVAGSEPTRFFTKAVEEWLATLDWVYAQAAA